MGNHCGTSDASEIRVLSGVPASGNMLKRRADFPIRTFELGSFTLALFGFALTPGMNYPLQSARVTMLCSAMPVRRTFDTAGPAQE